MIKHLYIYLAVAVAMPLIAGLPGVSFAETGCAAGDRYEDQNKGTILDCNTNLVWLKDASCAALGSFGVGGGADNWVNANAAAAALADGTCGLTDESMVGEWRLPTISEFCSAGAVVQICPLGNASDSLVDSSVGPPAVVNTAGDGVWTAGDPFVGVQSYYYWSASGDVARGAWGVSLNVGAVDDGLKASGFFVWPVRGGP